MAVQKIINGLLYALSSDTKPTTNAENTILYEIDTGDMYKYVAATGWKLFRSGSIASYRRRGTTNNRWYMASQITSATGTFTMVTNTFYAVPFAVEKKRTVQDLGVNVSTAGTGSAFRLGIYNDDGQLYPSSLVAEGPTQPVGTAIAFVSTNINTALEPGMYWLAVNVTGAPVVRSVTPAAAIPILGTDNVAGTTVPGMGWSVTRTYAALPATFTTGAAAMVATTGIPGIYVRFA